MLVPHISASSSAAACASFGEYSSPGLLQSLWQSLGQLFSKNL